MPRVTAGPVVPGCSNHHVRVSTVAGDAQRRAARGLVSRSFADDGYTQRCPPAIDEMKRPRVPCVVGKFGRTNRKRGSRTRQRQARTEPVATVFTDNVVTDCGPLRTRESRAEVAEHANVPSVSTQGVNGGAHRDRQAVIGERHRPAKVVVVGVLDHERPKLWPAMSAEVAVSVNLGATDAARPRRGTNCHGFARQRERHADAGAVGQACDRLPELLEGEVVRGELGAVNPNFPRSSVDVGDADSEGERSGVGLDRDARAELIVETTQGLVAVLDPDLAHCEPENL